MTVTWHPELRIAPDILNGSTRLVVWLRAPETGGTCPAGQQQWPKSICELQPRERVVNTGNSLFSYLSLTWPYLTAFIQKEKHAVVKQDSLTLRLEHKPVYYNARSTLNQGVATALPTGERERVNVPSLNSRHNPEINRLWVCSLFTCHGKNNSKRWLLLLAHFPLRTLPTSKAPFEVFLHQFFTNLSCDQNSVFNVNPWNRAYYSMRS